MSIDILAINTIALLLATAAGMLLVFALRKHIGFVWFIVVIEVLLFTLLIRRIDTIGAWFGVDVISQDMNDVVIAWLVIVTLYVSFAKMWQRRKDINEIEALHRRQAARLAEHEARMSNLVTWGDDESVTTSTQALNDKILQALK